MILSGTLFESGKSYIICHENGGRSGPNPMGGGQEKCDPVWTSDFAQKSYQLYTPHPDLYYRLHDAAASIRFDHVLAFSVVILEDLRADRSPWRTRRTTLCRTSPRRHSTARLGPSDWHRSFQHLLQHPVGKWNLDDRLRSHRSRRA
jgi:hypothetical protein